MSGIDLSALPVEDIQRLIKEAPLELERRRKLAKQMLYAKFEALARESGFTVAELLGEGAARMNGKVAKYRHPEQRELGWNGRGNKPGWVKNWLAAGGTMEQLAAAA